MKVLIVSFITVFSLLTSGCSNSVDTRTASESTIERHSPEAESLMTISGVIITENMQGRDGSTWNFKGNNGVLYSLVVSIPNLGKVESKNIQYVTPGAKLTIAGEVYNLGSKYNFIARKIAKTK